VSPGYSAYSAYAKSHSIALKGRGVEGEALMKAARLLEKARVNLENEKTLAEALKFNHKLWTVLQADISDVGNPLPEKTRADLLSLSLFMDQGTVKLLQGPDQEALQAMIDVNRTLASALLLQ